MTFNYIYDILYEVINIYFIYMAKNIMETSRLESQKYTDIKESHDDLKLASSVGNIMKLIHEGGTKNAKQQLEECFLISQHGKKIDLKSIILGIDFQDRPRSGRVSEISSNSLSPDGGDNFQLLIKNGSNLAKLIQLYIIMSDASVQKVN